MSNFISEYAPIVLFVSVLVYLLDATVGRLMDRATLKREAIRSEALKHFDKMMSGWEQ
jgi:hypothetical protein